MRQAGLAYAALIGEADRWEGLQVGQGLLQSREVPKVLEQLPRDALGYGGDAHELSDPHVLFLRVPLPLALAAVECWRPHTGRYARRCALALLDQMAEDRGGLLDVAAADQVRAPPEFNVETGV